MAALAAIGAMAVGATALSATAQAEEPVLSVVHETSAPDVGAGETIRYSVVVTNESCADLSGVTISIDLDDEVYRDLDTDLMIGGTTLIDGWTGVSFGSCEELAFGYVATAVDDIGEHREPAVNTVTVTDGSGASVDVVSRELPLRRPADQVEIDTGLAARQRLQPGGSIDYTLSVSNGGPLPVEDLVVALPIDHRFFSRMEASGNDTAQIDGRLVWQAGALATGEERLLAVGATTADRFATTTLAPVAVELAAGGTRRFEEVSLGVAAAPTEDLLITHRTVEPEVTIQPGDVVEYLVTLTSSGEGGGALLGVEVTVTPDSNVFDPESLASVGDDDGAEASGGTITWTGTSVEPAAPVEFRYEVEAVGSFLPVRSVTNSGTVTVDGQIRQADSAEAALGRAIDALEVTHTPSGGVDRVAPGDVVLYTVTVRNGNPLARIDDIRVDVDFDDDVFASPRRLFDESEDVEDLTWGELSLAGGEQVQVQYEVTAKAEFPDEVDTTSNGTRISVADVAAEAAPSAPLVLALPPRPDDSEDSGQTLDDWQRFVLIIVFVVITFVSGGLLIGRSGQGDERRRRELGILLFTTMSLVSATLILAFGSNVGDQALSLLAAIAGYVLGRRVPDGEDRDGPGDGGGQIQAVVPAPTLPGLAPSSESDASAVATVATVRSVPAGPVETIVHELQRAKQERRPLRRSAIVGALASPVPIVLCTVWLIDSATKTSIALLTYVAAGLLSALLVAFGLVMAYLISPATGPGGTVGQTTERRPDPGRSDAGTAPDDEGE